MSYMQKHIQISFANNSQELGKEQMSNNSAMEQ